MTAGPSAGVPQVLVPALAERQPEPPKRATPLVKVKDSFEVDKARQKTRAWLLLDQVCFAPHKQFLQQRGQKLGIGLFEAIFLADELGEFLVDELGGSCWFLVKRFFFRQFRGLHPKA